VWESRVNGLVRIGWSAGGELVGVVGDKGAVIFRGLETGEGRRLAASDVNDPRYATAYCPARSLLAVGGEGSLIHIWDVTTGRERFTFDTKAGAATHRLALSPDGRWLAVRTGGRDEARGVQLWDLSRGTLARRFAGEQEAIYGLQFSPDGKILAVMGWKGIRLWDVQTGRRRVGPDATFRHAYEVAFSPDGKTLAAPPRHGGAIARWDVATGARAPADPGHVTAPHQIDFSPDGSRLVSCDNAGDTAFVWDVATGRMAARVGGGSLVQNAYFSADGRGLFVAWHGSEVSYRDAATGRVLHAAMLSDPERPGHRQSAQSLHISDDRKSLVAASFGYPVGKTREGGDRLLLTGLDAATRGTIFRRHRADTPGFRAVSSDLGVLAGTSGDFRDPDPLRGVPVLLEDMRTGQPLVSLPRTETPTVGIGFSPDSRLVATGSGRPLPVGSVLRLCERESGGEILTLPAGNTYSWAFSPDSRILAVRGRGTEIVLWDLRRREEVRHLRGAATPANVLGFSPDGRRLVSGHEDGTLLVWDVAGPAKAVPAVLDAPGALKAWEELRGDAKRAFAARAALADSPEVALKLLRDRVKPVAPVEPAVLRLLLDGLDSDTFAVRDAARKRLEALGDRVAGGLQAALKADPTLEVRRRIEALLQHLRKPDDELLRALRAVAVLEDIGTPEARALLEAVAAGAAGARLTRDATAARARLDRRGR
jgi:WD40 repeat protein